MAHAARGLGRVWLGIEVSIAVLVFTALGTGDGRVRVLCFQALELLVVWPLFATGLVCLGSGALLGLAAGGPGPLLVGGGEAGVELPAHRLALVALAPEVSQSAEPARLFAAGQRVRLAWAS